MQEEEAMPHRNNIRYCDCEIKPLFGPATKFDKQKYTQYYNVLTERAGCPFYSFCNAQKLGKGP